MNEYLLRIKVIIDSLTPIGDSISDQNHIDVVLDGLPDGKGMSFVCTSNFRKVTSKNLEGIILDIRMILNVMQFQNVMRFQTHHY